MLIPDTKRHTNPASRQCCRRTFATLVLGNQAGLYAAGSLGNSTHFWACSEVDSLAS